MPHYRSVGDVPRKRHTACFDDSGNRYHEELMGQNGFSAASTLLYHRHSPSALAAIKPGPQRPTPDLTADQTVTPRHLRTGKLESTSDVASARHVLLANRDVSIGWAAAGPGASNLYRNAIGDELLYVQKGAATIETTFGSLDVAHGDYVVIPASTTHQWIVTEDIELLVIEARGHISPPARYLSDEGQFLEHAPYCERDLRAPTAPILREGSDVEVLLRTQAGLTRHIHCHHPFDVVGWDGHLYPWALNISDFEPIVGRLHQPPPVHQTFTGPGFVVCSFVPRPFDFHPDAVKVPYHHANTDSDEVIFYSAGDFMSRAGSGIAVGSISYHPMGFIHGPQPGSYEASLDKDRTEETAVMIDTFAPLNVTETSRSISDPEYPLSWANSPS